MDHCQHDRKFDKVYPVRFRISASNLVIQVLCIDVRGEDYQTTPSTNYIGLKMVEYLQLQTFPALADVIFLNDTDKYETLAVFNVIDCYNLRLEDA